MQFEWDENKNVQNLSKHGIDFNDAHILFENPILAKVDYRFDYGEKRWIALGKLETIIVVVVFTKRRNRIRIISMRKANKQERSAYNEKTDLNKLEKQPDSLLDYSDIPETDASFWNEAEIVYPAKKVPVSIRLDEDIVEWFKGFGKGYQTKINTVLKSYMRSTQKN